MKPLLPQAPKQRCAPVTLAGTQARNRENIFNIVSNNDAGDGLGDGKKSTQGRNSEGFLTMGYKSPRSLRVEFNRLLWRTPSVMFSSIASSSFRLGCVSLQRDSFPMVIPGQKNISELLQWLLMGGGAPSGKFLMPTEETAFQETLVRPNHMADNKQKYQSTDLDRAQQNKWLYNTPLYIHTILFLYSSDGHLGQFHDFIIDIDRVTSGRLCSSLGSRNPNRQGWRIVMELDTCGWLGVFLEN
ncbi:hypothetical protein STEG23_029846, partial [Scotinomys teguina]